MSQRERDRALTVTTQPKQRSKSNKRGVNKRRSIVPNCAHPRRERPKACTAEYRNHGFSSDNGIATPAISENPYEVMRKTVQSAINSAKIFDLEKNLTLNSTRRNKFAKGEDIHDSASSPPFPVGCDSSPKDGDGPPGVGVVGEGMGVAGTGDCCGQTRAAAVSDAPAVAAGVMEGNEDDEEYQAEEEEAERIISQGLSVQEITAVSYQTKKTITEQMRELQICVMERAAKKFEPKDLLSHFGREGYFDYNYDQNARATPSGTMNGTKKDTLYLVIGLSRKIKTQD